MDPAVLDACFHVMIHPSLTGDKDPNVYYLPSAIQSVILHSNICLEACMDTLYAYVTLQRWSPGRTVVVVLSRFTHPWSDEITFDLIVTDPMGKRICTFLAFTVARHEKVNGFKTAENKSHDLIYQPLSISKLPPSVFGQSMDVAELSLKTTTFKTSDDLSEHAVSGIVRILDFFVSTAKKRVIRILDVGPGTYPLIVEEQILKDRSFRHQLTTRQCEADRKIQHIQEQRNSNPLYALRTAF